MVINFLSPAQIIQMTSLSFMVKNPFVIYLASQQQKPVTSICSAFLLDYHEMSIESVLFFNRLCTKVKFFIHRSLFLEISCIVCY